MASDCGTGREPDRQEIEHAILKWTCDLRLEKQDSLMHEMGIVQSIMEIVEQQAELHKATRVVKVGLEFGALTAVLPDAIRFAFSILSKGGPAEDAVVDITIIPIKVRCMDCSRENTMDVYEPFCPSCGSASLQFIQGRDEIRIAFLEVEDGTD